MFVARTAVCVPQPNQCIRLCVHSTREHLSPEMNKLRQSLRRKKPTYVPEASRPHQWQADEEAVRKGKCNFPVRVGILLRLVRAGRRHWKCLPEGEP